MAVQGLFMAIVAIFIGLYFPLPNTAVLRKCLPLLQNPTNQRYSGVRAVA